MRRCLGIIALLAIGILTNLAVVMLSARFADHSPDWGIWKVRIITEIPAEAKEFLNDPEYLRVYGSDRPTGLESCSHPSLWCSNTSYTRWLDSRGTRSRDYDVISFGLPCRAMSYVKCAWFDLASFPEFAFWRLPGKRGGWPIAPAIARQVRVWSGYSPPNHVYPLTIMPVGFAMNSVVHAAGVWGLILAVPVVRGRRRRRRGLCPGCAYPVAGMAVCPECGKEVAAGAAWPWHTRLIARAKCHW